MRKLLFMALMAMFALTVFAPAALAQDDDDFNDDGFDDDDGTPAQVQPLPSSGGAAQDDDVNGVDDDNGNGIDDDDGVAQPMPATGGPALLPIAGLLLLLGAGSFGASAVTKRWRNRR